MNDVSCDLCNWILYKQNIIASSFKLMLWHKKYKNYDRYFAQYMIIKINKKGNYTYFLPHLVIM